MNLFNKLFRRTITMYGAIFTGVSAQGEGDTNVYYYGKPYFDGEGKNVEWEYYVDEQHAVYFHSKKELEHHIAIHQPNTQYRIIETKATIQIYHK